MSRKRISKRVRERVSQEAKFRCGYCLSSEAVVGAPMEIDHLTPVSLGGSDEQENLWLACSLCNDSKSNRIAALDPTTGQFAMLFNPRFDVWSENFRWNETSDRIIGLTPSGRATVLALRLNRATLVAARKLWVVAGWHPPGETSD